LVESAVVFERYGQVVAVPAWEREQGDLEIEIARGERDILVLTAIGLVRGDASLIIRRRLRGLSAERCCEVEETSE
jgi:hypothetical protein